MATKKKEKILREGMIGLKKSFGMMYSNLCLNSRETVPLKDVTRISRCTVNFLA